MAEETGSGEELIGALERWHESGAVWRVELRRPGRVTVALLRCDGGEEVGRLSSDDPEWIAFLRDRTSSED